MTKIVYIKDWYKSRTIWVAGIVILLTVLFAMFNINASQVEINNIAEMANKMDWGGIITAVLMIIMRTLTAKKIAPIIKK